MVTASESTRPGSMARPLVVAIYTGRGLDQQVAAAAADLLPDVRFGSILDDRLILDINEAGRITPAVVRRLVRYYLNAADGGAAVIFNTCSSIGEIVATGQSSVDVPIVRIDEPMAEAAVARFDRIGVLATLPSTVEPTRRLIEAKAAASGRDVEVRAEVAAGAYQALADGDPEGHDRLVRYAVKHLGDQVDGVVLAQASMARMHEELSATTTVPVLTSLRTGLLAVAVALGRPLVRS
jgi:Asp/Glu/hydantoin racemase